MQTKLTPTSGRQFRSLLRFGLTAVALILTATVSHAGLTNPSFESPRFSVGVGDVVFVLDSTVPGWKTTASDHMIEFWTDFGGVWAPGTAFDGEQLVELNANEVSTLYQDAAGIFAGAPLGFTFAHRGRDGTDVMRLTITDLGVNGVPGGGDDVVLFQKNYSTGPAAWVQYTSAGEPQIVALGNTVRFAYESVSAAGGVQSIGNLIDAADFGIELATPTKPTTWGSLKALYR